ncbi:MAG: hypothetical protein ACT4QC_21920 [Planctomycetaceae bacterium]
MKTLPLLLATLATILAPAVYAASPIPSGPIYTNKSRFRIPFHSDEGELRRMGAREIRLFVSRDRGRNWQQVQSVSPDAGKFQFQAQSDGEYWFYVRTLDDRNRLHPEGRPEAGLQVIVDTTQPTLQLSLRSPAPGKVFLSWVAADEHLDPAQLKLEYMPPGAGEWQVIGVVPTKSGQTEWEVPEGGLVAVRGSVGDLARNTAGDQMTVQVAPLQQGVPRPRSPNTREPIAGTVASPQTETAMILPREFPGDAGAKPNSKSASIARGEGASANATASVEPPRIRGSLVSQRVVEPDSTTISPRTSGDGQKPQPAIAGRRRAVNNLKFQIGYRLHADAGSVELYITDNNGARWYRYPTDAGGQTPLKVDVPRDGLYGFTLGMKDASGATPDAPRDGDPPTLEVLVDTVPPTVDLLPLEQGRGRNLDKIRISWRSADDFPAERPISLFYSSNGHAPWQPICTAIENTGSHIWTIDGSVPTKLYVRIEARDEAGNVQSAETPHPVLVKSGEPTARHPDAGASGTKNAVPKE